MQVAEFIGARERWGLLELFFFQIQVAAHTGSY